VFKETAHKKKAGNKGSPQRPWTEKTSQLKRENEQENRNLPRMRKGARERISRKNIE